MTETSSGGILLDRCPTCRGCWIDHYALDSLLQKRLPGRPPGDSSYLMNLAGSCAAGCLCPLCDEGLLSSERAGITVEWCPLCRGIFLDDGELDRLAAWRRAHFGRDVGERALAGVAEGASVAVTLGVGTLLSETLGPLFGGRFDGRSR
jgi:Zn-finger nucleic acid-binding protein